eukprot:Rhum_TRINITY_DN15181_c4_g1::Rhum_TRINITY_DN15181_c4_g1_i1::g.143311::m.143311
MRHRNQSRLMSKQRAQTQRATERDSRQQPLLHGPKSKKTNISEQECVRGRVRGRSRTREQNRTNEENANTGRREKHTHELAPKIGATEISFSLALPVLPSLRVAHQNLPRRLRMSESRGLWFVSTQSGTAVSSAQPPWYTEPYGTVMYCFANACSIDHQFELGAVCAFASTLKVQNDQPSCCSKVKICLLANCWKCTSHHSDSVRFFSAPSRHWPASQLFRVFGNPGDPFSSGMQLSMARDHSPTNTGIDVHVLNDSRPSYWHAMFSVIVIFCRSHASVSLLPSAMLNAWYRCVSMNTFVRSVWRSSHVHGKWRNASCHSSGSVLYVQYDGGHGPAHSFVRILSSMWK